MKFNLRKSVTVVPVFVVLIIFSVWFALESVKPHSCTIFTAVQGDTVLFGDNWDYHEGDLIIGFFPPSSTGYGSIHFGFRKGDMQSYQRVVNDQGLTWAVNSIPRSKLNPHPEKSFSYIEDEFLHTISKKAATVEDAIRIAQNFDFGDSMIVQIHIADAGGDAVVIGPGPDGEIAFTRKSPGEGYLLSTNFNLATQKGPVDFRWDTAKSMLETLSESQALTPEFAGEILEVVHLKTLTTHTLFSNVIDLKNGEVYIYYMSQYGEAAKLNITQELAKGQRIVNTRDLLSPETADAGDAAYQRFETRFRVAQVAVIAFGLAVIILLSSLLVRWLSRKRRSSPSKPWSSATHIQSARLLAVDALRGLIIVFMALDHANYFIAQKHSSGEYWGGVYPIYAAVTPFLTRLVTHFCAPGFFFLMGVGMTLFTLSRQKRGWSRGQIIRHFLLRGALLIALQLLVVNRAWELSAGGWEIELYFGVLYALGGVMILSNALLWLKPRYLVGISLFLLVGTELLVPDPSAWGQNYPLIQNLLFFAGGDFPTYWVNYPILAWLELAVFGLAFGQWLAHDREKTLRLAAGLGLVFLIAFALLRGLNGFGNLRPIPGDGWMNFLNPVKYPPSITFTFLTLGVNLLLLWLFARIEEKRSSLLRPLVVFGCTPLFFYILHLFLYAIVGRLLTPQGVSIALMLPFWILGLIIIFPLCQWYAGFKVKQPNQSVLKFL